jgi:hypothetical protein
VQFAFLPQFKVLGKENRAHSVLAALRQLHTRVLLESSTEERVGHGQKKSSTVTTIDIATTSTTMGHALENLDTILYDLVGWFGRQLGNHTHTTCILFQRRVIQANFRAKDPYGVLILISAILILAAGH